MRSWPGLVIWDRTTVSPDRTDFTRASNGMVEAEAKEIKQQERKKERKKRDFIIIQLEKEKRRGDEGRREEGRGGNG